jgi:hypothetical protein
MTGCIVAIHHSTDISAYTVAVKIRKFLLLHGVKMVKFGEFTTHGSRPILVRKVETSGMLSRHEKEYGIRNLRYDTQEFVGSNTGISPKRGKRRSITM